MGPNKEEMVNKTKVAKKETKSTKAISDELKRELAASKIVTHGRIFVGTVIGTKAAKTIRVEWPRSYYLSKYERYEKRRTRVQAHLPELISVELGDKVRISGCRPISKTKKFVVIQKLEDKK